MGLPTNEIAWFVNSVRVKAKSGPFDFEDMDQPGFPAPRGMPNWFTPQVHPDLAGFLVSGGREGLWQWFYSPKAGKVYVQLMPDGGD
jgi:hypothetical protein